MPTPDDKRVDLVASLRDAVSDTDGDGVTDADEPRAGTDPDDAHDTPMDFNQLGGLPEAHDWVGDDTTWDSE